MSRPILTCARGTLTVETQPVGICVCSIHVHWGVAQWWNTIAEVYIPSIPCLGGSPGAISHSNMGPTLECSLLTQLGLDLTQILRSSFKAVNLHSILAQPSLLDFNFAILDSLASWLGPTFGANSKPCNNGHVVGTVSCACSLTP